MQGKRPIKEYEPVAPNRAPAHIPVPVRPLVEPVLNDRSAPRHATEKRGGAGGASSHIWLVRRGHAISFFGFLLFSFVVYFRPYEWSETLAGLTSLAFYTALFTLAVFIPTQFALEGNLTTRPREVNLLLLLGAAALLSIPLAINPGEAWAKFSDEYAKVIVMFIVMVNVVRTERRLKMVLWLALAVSIVLSIAAVNDFRLGRLAVRGERIAGAIGGLFGNPNDLALHLATMIPLALAFGINVGGIVRRLFYFACAVLMTATIVVTFSRGGFLGFAAGAFVLAWKLGRRRRFAVVAGSMLLVFCFFLFAPGNYGGRISTIVSVSADETGSSYARRALFFRALYTAVRNPVFGVGIGNFHIVSIREQVSHNAYLEVAAEMGFAAMVFYILFIVTSLKRLRGIERTALTDDAENALRESAMGARRKQRAKTPDEKKARRLYHLAIALQASIVAFMVSSFFASVPYNWYIYYLVGYALCLSRIYETHRQHVAAEAGVVTPAGAMADAAPPSLHHARAASI